MSGPEVSAFLTDLAVSGHVSASTQNQALNALVFLYKQVLGLDLGVLRRGPHRVLPREAVIWTAVWITLAALFCIGIWQVGGANRALQFLAGYVSFVQRAAR